MENIGEKQILEKILLPLNTNWEVSVVETNEKTEEINVELRYRFDYVE